MFQAFVDEGPAPARSPQGPSSSGSRTGLIAGGVAAVAAVLVLLFLVLG